MHKLLTGVPVKCATVDEIDWQLDENAEISETAYSLGSEEGTGVLSFIHRLNHETSRECTKVR